MEVWIKFLGLFALCGTKFFLGVPALIYAGYSYWETILVSSAGGLSGFFVFYYFGELIKILFRKFFPGKKETEKKKFTRRNRFIVGLKGKYGLTGLAILTPVVFSIPLGSLLAARYFDEEKSTIPVMTAFVVIWSFVLTTFYHFIEPLF